MWESDNEENRTLSKERRGIQMYRIYNSEMIIFLFLIMKMKDYFKKSMTPQTNILEI